MSPIRTNNLRIKCGKQPIAIKKHKVCRACYAKMRRAGNIHPYDPMISIEVLGEAVLSRLERQQTQIAQERKISKDLIEQNNFLIQQNDQLKRRVIELQKEIGEKKTRALRLSDLQKLVQSEG